MRTTFEGIWLQLASVCSAQRSTRTCNIGYGWPGPGLTQPSSASCHVLDIVSLSDPREYVRSNQLTHRSKR
jgi:hypothetical protein